MSQSVARQLGELGCLTEDLLKADVVFCKDLARPSTPAVMRALLAGCLVATPAALSAKTAVGACTQYRSALKTRRKLYISDAFVDEHPDEAAVLVDPLERSRSISGCSCNCAAVLPGAGGLCEAKQVPGDAGASL